MNESSNEYFNKQDTLNKENQKEYHLNMSRKSQKRHGISNMNTYNSAMNEPDDYKIFNDKSNSSSKDIDSKSFIEENSIIENLSIATNQFDLKSSQKNFWTYKMASFVSLLLEKEFLDSSLNYESVMEVYQSIAFKDDFKNNLKRVSYKFSVLYLTIEQHGDI